MPSNAPDVDQNAPVGVDTTRASVARLYDFLLGGKDNYKIDRQAAAELAAAMPDVVDLAKETDRYGTSRTPPGGARWGARPPAPRARSSSSSRAWS